ncbi:MAG: hypothetical protein U0411_02210 [Thermodesulfovibrionales bacterium]
MQGEKALRFFCFFILLAVLVGALKLINWLPLAIEKGTLRKYAGIEELRAHFPHEKIYLPSYFPRNLAWPPAKIVAQRKPSTAITMYFSEQDTGKVGMTIQQLGTGAGRPPSSALRVVKPLRESQVLIRDRAGTLVAALCEEEAPCHQLSWREGNFTLILTATVPQRELIRMAASMLP